MKCSVQVGEGEVKPLIAGITKSYKPEDILNRLVITILNLKPIKLKGEPSEVMLFASTDIQSKNLCLLQPPEGSEVKHKKHN
jgi:methionyl-tRNA synthetase